MAGEFTQADLEAINAAIASGATSVRHGDKAVTYNTTAELIALRDRIIRELGGTTTHRPSRHLVKFSRGDR